MASQSLQQPGPFALLWKVSPPLLPSIGRQGRAQERDASVSQGASVLLGASLGEFSTALFCICIADVRVRVCEGGGGMVTGFGGGGRSGERCAYASGKTCFLVIRERGTRWLG